MLVSLFALLLILVYYQKEATGSINNSNKNKKQKNQYNHKTNPTGDDIDFDSLIDAESVDLGSEGSFDEKSIETVYSDEFSDEYSDESGDSYPESEYDASSIEDGINIESEILL